MSKFMKLDERVIFSLRKLYQSYGYQQFKMSKFEPYDFYMQNKEFLVSQRVITFTDTDGTLMALKPDVTLSIVKNFRQTPLELQKVCYSENIYRIAGAGKTYREIVQTGLECLGNLGAYERSEVLLLALKSLEQISDQYILDISHLGVLTKLLIGSHLENDLIHTIIDCMEAKNESALKENDQIPETLKEQLLQLMAISGPLSQIIANSELPEFIDPMITEQLAALGQFVDEMGYADHVNLDFSIVSNRDYYNGLVFKGYVKGLPSELLSGGQYDQLMEKMGKHAQGLGFAVYLDQLELLEHRTQDMGADILLICNPDENLSTIHQVKERLEPERVFVVNRTPKKLPNCKVLKLENGRLTEVERNG